MNRQHEHVSRRRFLRDVGLAAGAVVAAPAVARSGALGVAGHPSASDRIQIGHIGLGGMGNGHLGRYARNTKYPAVAVSDVDDSAMERAAKRVGTHCAKHNDYRELLDRKDVDAVVIAVPDHWHAACAVHSCEAGKDVYCEKPLSLTIAEARKMVNAARRYHRVFQTGSQQRSAQEFRKACELVRNGRLGTIHTVKVSVWGTSEPCRLPGEDVPAGLDWERWIGPAPWRPYNSKLHPYNWRRYREFSGGTMTDWGAHHLDIAQWGLGMDESGPVEVRPPADGNRHVTIVYANGVRVLCGAVRVNGVQFVGPRGTITVNRGYFSADPVELGAVEMHGSALRLYKSPGHHKDWLNCIRTRSRPVADVEVGCRSVTVCHLANLAIWLGRPVRWDPAAEKIIGDAEAERWVSRPYRAPYHL